tara:strand:+ start:368 stop:574 length:207 start_codon:yes stop_codon:yes gene_type:complete
MIKKLIEKIFGKFCKCEEKTKSTSDLLKEGFEEEQKILELEETIVEKIQCNTHSRFKKSCPLCVEAAK